MKASYIFRMDDITPTMDWNRFWALMQLFRRHDIRPLLGVVPDNRDPNLVRSHPHPNFWETLRELQDSNAVDIAQHGYQHILVHRPRAALLGPSVGIKKEVSEFAGDTYNDQSFRIAEGKRILERHGLSTSYWMAPNHSFDTTTLRALRDNGFTAVSDGIALFPYRSQGLTFVPQTSWRPRWMPLGIHTICLHTNTITPRHVQQLRTFLRRPFTFTRFSEAVTVRGDRLSLSFTNTAYEGIYRTLWAARNGSTGISMRKLPRVGSSLPGKALQSEPVLPQP